MCLVGVQESKESYAASQKPTKITKLNTYKWLKCNTEK
jgi:hypothetical protein